MMDKIVVLENDCIKVQVCPEVGAGIYAMEYKRRGQWVHIMRPTPPSAVDAAAAGEFSSFNMIPYSNRIENALLFYNGKEYRLEPNTPEGHRIHGDVRDKAWKVELLEQERLAVSFDSRDYADVSWPFPFAAKMEFWLEGNRFLTKMEVRNTGEETMPAGMGIHPYFMRKLTEKDEVVEVRFPVKGVYPGPTTIPTGPWTEIPERIDFSTKKALSTDFLDRCYRVAPGDSIIEWPASGVRLTITPEEIFKHLILYCPKHEHGYFAVEPVTNCNNGFNMAEKGIQDTGTLYIEPGQSIEGTIAMKVESF